jgi:N-acetylglucosamine repressor
MAPKRIVQAKSERDEHLVEYVVRRFGPISRARIHELTQIRPSATSQIVRQLLDAGRLVEDGVENGRLGRKGALLRLNEESRCVACLQFDDETITAGVANLRPSITKTRTDATPLNGGAEALTRQLIRTLKACLRGVPSESVIGIGIADPGLVDSRRGVVLSCSTIPFWREIPLKEIFDKEFGIPATVDTHTRAKAVAERDSSGAETRETMFYIDYGAGIGAGLVTDGRLMYGQTSGAGEFGHMHVVDSDTACNCGSYGCLEAVAGLRAVEARVRRAVADGGKTEVLQMAGGDPSRINGWMVFEAASRGDKIAGNTVAAVGRHLGLGIANLVNLFNPGAVVLDWRLRTAGGALLDEIQATVKLQALREFTANLEIRYATQGGDAGILGMARMVLDEHMAVPAWKLPLFLQETR